MDDQEEACVGTVPWSGRGWVSGVVSTMRPQSMTGAVSTREFQSQLTGVGRPTLGVAVSIPVARGDPEAHTEEKMS